MTPNNEFDRFLELLRCESVNPEELVRHARDWSPDRDPPFFQYISQKLTPHPAADIPAQPVEPIHSASADVTPLGTELSTVSLDSSTPTQTLAGATVAMSTTSAETADPSFSTTRYVPIRLYRSGGLGSVWLARDTVIGRDVALKTIRADRKVTPAIVDGFVREAQMTGRLEHPCIVPVYDLPEAIPGDTPSYVMRFVVGRTLAEGASEFHKGQPGDRFALARLLDAVVAVARAVGFAHSKGILHRDLKGQNVVIGEFGEVFLLDWGLAAHVEDPPAESGSVTTAGATPRGSVVGTPAFMAPELLDGGMATKASDVYGLGGTLYQVLTGKAPYTGALPADVIRQIRTADPIPVRQLNPSIPPALAAICHKALARNLTVRYPSAESFATELRRYLADETVEAYREPWLTRAGRWARRHRTTVAVLAVLVPTIAIGSLLAAALVWREKQNTETEFRRAEAEWGRATQNFAAASGLAYELGERVNNIETGIEDQKSNDMKRLAAVDSARKVFEKLQLENPKDDTLRRQTAMLHRFAGNLRRFLGIVDGAETAYQTAIAHWEALCQDGATGKDLEHYVMTISDYAVYLKRYGKVTDAIKQLDIAEKLAAGLKDRVQPSVLNRTLGTLHSDRADVEYRLGLFQEAEITAKTAAAELDSLASAPKAEQNPIDPVLASGAHLSRAEVLRELGRVAEASAASSAAIDRANLAGGAKGGTDARYFTAKTILSRAQSAERAAALQDYQTGIESLVVLVKEYPRRLFYQETLAHAYLLRGKLYAAGDDVKLATADYDAALTITRKLVDTPPQMADHIALRGRIFIALGRITTPAAKAKEEFARAVRVLDIAQKKDPGNVLTQRALDEARTLLDGKR